VLNSAKSEGDIKNIFFVASVDIVLDHTLDIDYNPVLNSAKSEISKDYFRPHVARFTGYIF